jgi:hypothetical protein
MPPPDDRDKSQPSTLEPHVITLRIEGAGHVTEPRARIDRQHMDPTVPPVMQLLLDMRKETGDGFEKLHKKVDTLAEKLDDVRDEHADLRERVAKVETNDKRDAEERAAFAAGGTGRFHVAPMEGPRPPQPSSPMLATPSPTPAIAFNIGANAGGDLRIGSTTQSSPSHEGSQKRHSVAPPSVMAWLDKAARSRVLHIGLLACAAVGGGFAHYLLSPPPPPPTIQYVTVPAPQAAATGLPAPAASPVVTPAPSTTSTAIDAGRSARGR